MTKPKKSGIGGGMENLIPINNNFKTNNSQNQIITGKALEINISEIKENPYQPRKEFNELEIIKLKESIKEKGIIEPLIVIKKDNGYELIAGQRRLMAAKAANFEKVPVIIRDKITNQSDKLELALIENMLRQDLNAIEEAEAFSKLEKEFSIQPIQIGKIVGKDRSTVENTIRLLKLPNPVKDDIIKSRLTPGHGKALLPLNFEDLILEVRNIILEKSLTVRQTELLVKSKLKQTSNKKEYKNIEESSYYESLSNQISENIGGLKVNIKYKGKNKKLEIIYTKSKDIELILEKLNIKPF
jgi:ParB family chromosome partitioning protein